MPLSVTGIILDNLTSDPSTPADGHHWYNSTDDADRLQRGAETFETTANDSICVYDNVGGQTFTTTAITVNLDTVAKNMKSGIYSLSADVVTVAKAGTYRIDYEVSSDDNSSGRVSATAWVEKNTVKITGSESAYMVRTVNQPGTGAGSFVIDLVASDALRLRTVRISGSVTMITEQYGSRLTVQRMF